MRSITRRWLSPQTVPRGFLRLYILMVLSHGPESGYSIMRMIDERTDGAWRPGPGTMYPLLKGLAKDGLARQASGNEGAKAYAITPKGRRALEDMQGNLASTGRRERVLGRLFFDLLPANVFIPMMINRYKEGVDLFRQKIADVPQPERDAYLKDIRLFLEGQLGWIDGRLGQVKAVQQARGRK